MDFEKSTASGFCFITKDMLLKNILTYICTIELKIQEVYILFNGERQSSYSGEMNVRKNLSNKLVKS